MRAHRDDLELLRGHRYASYDYSLNLTLKSVISTTIEAAGRTEVLIRYPHLVTEVAIAVL